MVDIRPYSSALLELATEENKVETILSQLKDCADLWKENNDLTLYLKHPKVLKKEKEAMIQKIISSDYDPLLNRFLSVLASHNCAAYVEQIYDNFVTLLNEKENREVVLVESAHALDDDQQEQLRQVLSEKLKKEIKLNVEVHPELIGGLRVKTQEFVLDNTLLSKAEKMKETIKKNS